MSARLLRIQHPAGAQHALNVASCWCSVVVCKAGTTGYHTLSDLERSLCKSCPELGLAHATSIHVMPVLQCALRKRARSHSWPQCGSISERQQDGDGHRRFAFFAKVRHWLSEMRPVIASLTPTVPFVNGPGYSAQVKSTLPRLGRPCLPFWLQAPACAGLLDMLDSIGLNGHILIWRLDRPSSGAFRECVRRTAYCALELHLSWHRSCKPTQSDPTIADGKALNDTSCFIASKTVIARTSWNPSQEGIQYSRQPCG